MNPIYICPKDHLPVPCHVYIDEYEIKVFLPEYTFEGVGNQFPSIRQIKEVLELDELSNLTTRKAGSPTNEFRSGAIHDRICSSSSHALGKCRRALRASCAAISIGRTKLVGLSANSVCDAAARQLS